MIVEFTSKYLVDMLCSGSHKMVIEDHVIYNGIDFDIHEIVFMALDGYYYKTQYTVNHDQVTIGWSQTRVNEWSMTMVSCTRVYPSVIDIQMTTWSEVQK